MNHQIVSPLRFHLVQPGIYSGGYPTLRNFRFIKRLKLKLIISLIPEEPIKDLIEFCKNESIEHIYINSKYYKECVCLNYQQINEIIEKLIDKRNYPIYVHCLNGSNVSHQLIMCLRRLQNWNFKCIQSEANRYCNEIIKEEFQFIKDWKGEIKVPEGNLPTWLNELWWNSQIVSHPILNLKFSLEKKRQKRVDLNETKKKDNLNDYLPFIDLPFENVDGIHSFNSLSLDSLSLEYKNIDLSFEFDTKLPENLKNISTFLDLTNLE